MLQVKGLTKKYGDFLALDHIDLELDEGKIFGFVGPNGAGKTTTMRILSTLMAPTAGEASIDGVSVTDSPRQVRRKIGYMPDFFGVYDNLKVGEYLEFYGRANGLNKKECDRTSGDLLELVYLSDKREAYVDSLSRGMKQRLCLARTLVHSPRLLILDEPASGMDPRARMEMKGILKTLKNMKKTILISSHILPELEELCDVLGIIENGKFVFQGTMNEMMQRVHGGSKIRITLKQEQEKAVSILKEHPGINDIEQDEDVLVVSFVGNDEGKHALLRALVLADVPVLGFAAESGGLESAFMEVSNGD